MCVDLKIHLRSGWSAASYESPLQRKSIENDFCAGHFNSNDDEFKEERGFRQQYELGQRGVLLYDCKPDRLGAANARKNKLVPCIVTVYCTIDKNQGQAVFDKEQTKAKEG